MERNKYRVRVRAIRSLVLSDGSWPLVMVPKGMTGTLYGCGGEDGKTEHFGVVWDYIAKGDPYINVCETDGLDDDEHQPPEVVKGDDFVSEVKPEDIEFIGVEVGAVIRRQGQ